MSLNDAMAAIDANNRLIERCDTLRDATMTLEAAWSQRPRITLACAGYSDEHWQFRRNGESEMPDATWIEPWLR